MKRLLGIVFSTAVLLIALASPSSAQIFVVQTCGTVPASMKTLVPGAPGMFFEDTTGTLCTGSSAGGAVTIANGAAVPLGSTTDAPATTPTDASAATMIALLKAMTNGVVGPIPAGSAIIGALVANQSVNEAQINGVTPLMGQGQTGTGAQRMTLSQDSTSAPINISTATTTQLVAASGSLVIYLTAWDVIAGGTGNITLQSADTGGACANPVALTGAYPLVAQAGISKGSGMGTVLKLPAGKALCALTNAAVQMSGSVSYLQF